MKKKVDISEASENLLKLGKYKYTENKKLNFIVATLPVQTFIMMFALGIAYATENKMFYIMVFIFPVLLIAHVINIFQLIKIHVEREIYTDRLLLLNTIFPDIK